MDADMVGGRLRKGKSLCSSRLRRGILAKLICEWEWWDGSYFWDVFWFFWGWSWPRGGRGEEDEVDNGFVNEGIACTTLSECSPSPSPLSSPTPLLSSIPQTTRSLQKILNKVNHPSHCHFRHFPFGKPSCLLSEAHNPSLLRHPLSPLSATSSPSRSVRIPLSLMPLTNILWF